MFFKAIGYRECFLCG